MTEHCYRALHRALLPSIATDGRTDGLTESIQPRVEILGFRNARAHIRGFISRLALVRALADAEAEAAS